MKMHVLITVAFTSSLLSALIYPAHGFFRIPCASRLMDQRMDPIVVPGAPSAHVHTVAGGNGMVSLFLSSPYLEVAELSQSTFNTAFSINAHPREHKTISRH